MGSGGGDRWWSGGRTDSDNGKDVDNFEEKEKEATEKLSKQAERIEELDDEKITIFVSHQNRDKEKTQRAHQYAEYIKDIIIWEKKHVLFSQEFKARRMIAFRWSLTPGEAYGRGPAIKKLPDIRTANKIVELTLGNAALQMSGVYTGRADGIFNPHTARISPGSILPVSSNDNANPTLRPMTPSGNLGLADGLLREMQDGIRKAFFADPLGDLSDPVRSATENIIRNQEFLKNSGASIGRLKSELIEPLVAAVVDIMIERGKMPEIAVDGKDVTIKQTSPLAKAEDQEKFQNTQLWLSSMAEFVPKEVMALKVKVEDLPREFQQQLGTNPDLIRSDAETEGVAQTVQQAAGASLEGGLPGEAEAGV